MFRRQQRRQQHGSRPRGHKRSGGQQWAVLCEYNPENQYARPSQAYQACATPRPSQNPATIETLFSTSECKVQSWTHGPASRQFVDIVTPLPQLQTH
mmetsp:Transcript_28982/g.46814  ORF Transcript_28982/g.46814 Transcript_28982/m.46814 type:complete len:97 (-) Transcript_28982:1499-1789(-)